MEGRDGNTGLYKYSGKELDEESDLNWYYFGARYYDPAIARWMAEDPLADSYPSWSPYNYTMNNPIIFVDPDGRIVAYAGEDEEEAYNKYKDEVNKRAAAAQEKVSNYEKKIASAGAIKKFFLKIGLSGAKADLQTYSGIQNELAALERSSTTFMIRMGSNIASTLPANAGGSTTYNTKTDQVDINIGSSNTINTTQITAHELKHGYQYLTGDLDFNSSGTGGGLFYDRTDELAAFQRQNHFGPGINAYDQVHKRYSKLPLGPKSFNLLTPVEKKQYMMLKNKGKFH